MIFKKISQKLTDWWRRIDDIINRDDNLSTDEQPPYTHCLNCGTELSGMYCHKCGQQATLPVPKIWDYVKEYIKNVTCIDSQSLPTLLSLFFRPGKLVKDYCAGRYASYSHPIQINFFIFFVLIILFSNSNAEANLGNSMKEIVSKELFISDMVLSTIQKDSEYMLKVESSPRDTVTLVASHNIVDKHKGIVGVLDVISVTDVEIPDTLIATVPTILRDDKILVENDGKYYFSTDNDMMNKELMLTEFTDAWMVLVSILLNNFQLLLFLSIPFLAYAIRLVLIRRKFPSMYCFIFSLYYIAFVEILMIFLYIMSLIFNFSFSSIQILLNVIIFLYLTMALKQTYDISTWWKSAFAALFVNVTYGVLCLSMTTLLSLIIIVAAMLL